MSFPAEGMDVFVETSRSPESGFASCRCPIHADRTPSASLLFREGRPVAMFCFGACAARRGARFVRFRVLRAEPSEGGWNIRVAPESAEPERAGGTSRKSKRLKKPAPSSPDQPEEPPSLVIQEAVERMKAEAVPRLEALLAGKRKETPEAWRMWLEIKRIDPARLERERPGLEFPPLFLELAVVFPLIPIPTEPGLPARYHLRFHAGVKAINHPTDSSQGRVWAYAPRGFRPGSPVVVVEAPQHALRIALLTDRVLPLAAMGIGNAARLAQAASEAGGVVVRVFADDPVAVPGAAGVDLDEVASDERLLRLIGLRVRGGAS
jgi:hypothetical protein